VNDVNLRYELNKIPAYQKQDGKTHSNRKKMLVPVDDFYALLLTDIY
jgi:hypothetical protein